MPKKEITAEQRKALIEREDVRAILQKAAYRYTKNYELHKLGLTNIEISCLTGCSPGNVSRDIWGYTSGRVKYEN